MAHEPPFLPSGMFMPIWLTSDDETVKHVAVGEPERPVCDVDNEEYSGRLATLDEVQAMLMCEDCRSLLLAARDQEREEEEEADGRG